MLVFVPVTVAGSLLGFPPIAMFILASLAIVPLAKYIGDSTEELAAHTNPALGGLLNATFGNATEIIISLFALQKGLIEVVKASITGSIIGNLLLVLGLAILCGGWKREKQTFNRTVASANGTVLLIAVAALVIPDAFIGTAPNVPHVVLEKLSLWVSALMLLGYGCILLFALKTHKHLFGADEEHHSHRWSAKRSTLILLASTLAVVWMSEILVGSLEPLIHEFGWSELFIGVIFVAIVGNAAEHSSAVTSAVRNKMELSIQIAVGSAVQIAMFAAPVLVLASTFLSGNMMTLDFNWFEVVAVLIAVFTANHVAQDGETNWWEGAGLLIVYLIMGVAFYYHP